MGERIQHSALIIFALAFIAILAMMNGTVRDIGSSVNGQLTRTYAATEMHELQAFDDTKVTGTTVISAIKNYNSLYSYDMGISVTTSRGTYTYGAGGAYGSYDVTNSGDSRYINPTKSFSASLAENANGVITGIEFTEQ